MYRALLLRFESVKQRYHEPHRVAHGIDYLLRMIKETEKIRDHIRNVPAFEVATYWSKAVHHLSPCEDAEASITVLYRDLGRLASEQLLDTAESLIRVGHIHMWATTGANLDNSQCPDAPYYADLHMSIYGCGPMEMAAHEDAYTQEFVPVVGEFRYLTNRLAMVENYLTRSSLYMTTIYNPLEKKTRQNLERLRTQLQTRIAEASASPQIRPKEPR